MDIEEQVLTLTSMDIAGTLTAMMVVVTVSGTVLIKKLFSPRGVESCEGSEGEG